MHEIAVKRAYLEALESDGLRILVDRLWPRGVSKEKLALHEWLRDIAPSAELRKWSGHDPAKWEEFRRRYFAELDQRGELVGALLEKARENKVTLVFSARDEARNNAIALRDYLERRAGA